MPPPMTRTTGHSEFLLQEIDEFRTIRRCDRVLSRRQLMEPRSDRAPRHIPRQHRAAIATIHLPIKNTAGKIDQNRLRIDNGNPISLYSRALFEHDG